MARFYISLFRKNTTFLLLVAVAFLLAVLTVAFSEGVKRRVLSLPRGEMLSEADVGVADFKFYQVRDGRLEWQIRARKADVYEQEHTVFLKDITLILKTLQGFTVTFDGEEGKLNTETGDFFLRKAQEDIKIHFSNGYDVKTNNINWNEERREISTESPVEITGPGGVEIRGRGLIALMEEQELRLTHDVEAFLKK